MILDDAPDTFDTPGTLGTPGMWVQGGGMNMTLAQFEHPGSSAFQLSRPL